MNFPDIILDNGSNYFDHMNPIQTEFHTDDTQFRWLAGAVCSGKSIAACVEAFWHSWTFAGNKGWILRETYDEIDSSVMEDLFEVLPEWVVFQHNKNKHWVDIVNQYGIDHWLKNRKTTKMMRLRTELERIKGLSRIRFRSFESTLHGERKMRSSKIGWFFVDQAEESTEELHKELLRRLRHQPAALRGWYVSNPDGHDWLWRYFAPESNTVKRRHKMFKIQTTDNQANLVENYEDNLRETHTDEEYAQQVLGSFDVATGAIFTEFSPGIHVIKHVEPPDEWVKGIGLDPGLNNPTGIMLCSRLPSGDIYWYWEWQEKEHLVSQEAEILRNAITPQHRFRVIDHSCVNRSKATGLSLLDEYNRHGLTFMPSDKDVTAGLNRMKEYMKFDPEKENPFTGKKGSPRWFVSDRCPLFIEQLLSYRKSELASGRGKKNVPEKPHKYKDHLIDASRYVMVKMTHPLTVASASNPDENVGMYGSLRPEVKENYMDEEGQINIERLVAEGRQGEPRVEATTWLEA